MHRYPVFYSSLPDIGAGFMPVEAEDSYEAEQIVQREYPGAITASLSENMTDEKEEMSFPVRTARVEFYQVRQHQMMRPLT